MTSAHTRGGRPPLPNQTCVSHLPASRGGNVLRASGSVLIMGRAALQADDQRCTARIVTPRSPAGQP
jgi:hypothetical protein